MSFNFQNNCRFNNEHVTINTVVYGPCHAATSRSNEYPLAAPCQAHILNNWTERLAAHPVIGLAYVQRHYCLGRDETVHNYRYFAFAQAREVIFTYCRPGFRLTEQRRWNGGILERSGVEFQSRPAGCHCVDRTLAFKWYRPLKSALAARPADVRPVQNRRAGV